MKRQQPSKSNPSMQRRTKSGKVGRRPKTNVISLSDHKKHRKTALDRKRRASDQPRDQRLTGWTRVVAIVGVIAMLGYLLTLFFPSLGQH